MKKSIIIALTLSMNVFAQAPSVQWKKSFGGTKDDLAHSVLQTTDGGYIVAGETASNDGDITFNHSTINNDCWLTKLDASGLLQWQKSYGGGYEDFANEVIQTTDGGYVFVGGTSSQDGDVMGTGSESMWIVKLNSAGAIQWQKTYTDEYGSYASSVKQTADGGYIVAGNAFSIGGDCTTHLGGAGEPDYWILKLDANGALQWQKTYGGTGFDQAFEIQITADGGYIVTGSCETNDGDVTGNHGDDDFWVLKLNAAGTIQWQKSLGGTGYDYSEAVKQTADGGYIIGGYAESNDGNVTGHHGTTSLGDYWIVKLNSSGILQWQKSLGGTDQEGVESIQLTADGGFVVAGWSSSLDGDVTGNHGGRDYWIVKLDASGTLQWEKSLGGTGNDEGECIQQTSDGGYIITGFSPSNDGDITDHHGSSGIQDFWVVKLGGNGTTDITDSKNENNFKIYPNPGKHFIDIDLSNIKSTEFLLTISDVTGSLIHSEKIIQQQSSVHLDVSNLAGGVYIVNIVCDGTLLNKKFIKE